MKRKKLRIGFIGCGSYMQYFHLPEVLADKRTQLAAVADPDPAQIASLLGKAGHPIPAYADYKEMIRREALDAVYISTPHSMHYEQVRFALLNDLHVLVQKPFTIRSDHALKLVALAGKKSRYIMVSYQRFFQEQSVYARELVASGHIGEIRAVACYITQNFANIKGWRANPALSGGGFMMDTGSHLISSMLAITGLRPVEVTAVMENYGNKTELSSMVIVRFSNGSVGSLDFFGNTKFHDECISIHGSTGCIVLRGYEWGVSPLLVNNQPMDIPARLKPNSPDSTFITWICNGGKNYTPPQIAIDTIKITEAAYRSNLAKKAVRVRL